MKIENAYHIAPPTNGLTTAPAEASVDAAAAFSQLIYGVAPVGRGPIATRYAGATGSDLWGDVEYQSWHQNSRFDGAIH